MSPSYR